MAVTLSATDLLERAGVADPAEQTRLGTSAETAIALVDRWAPDAPDAVCNEAAIRVTGWLVEQPRAAIRSETTGDVRTDYAASMQSALRHSGAMALLSAWKQRRAGAI